MMFLGKILTVACAALLLAGCTADDNRGATGGNGYQFKITESKRGLPTQLQGNDSSTSPSIYWSDKNRRTATLVTYGSGSCPVVPTNLVLSSERAFRLPLKEYRGACTADLGPRVSVFAVPEKVSRTKAVTVTLDEPQAGAADTQLTLGPSSVLTELGK